MYNQYARQEISEMNFDEIITRMINVDKGEVEISIDKKRFNKREIVM